MISIADAERKLRVIDPKMDAAVELLAKKILNGQAQLTQANHDDSPVQKKLLHFAEHRLAQPHLRYLAADQVNETWGGSTTKALQTLGQSYHLALDEKNPAIGQSFMLALLDGTRPNERPMPAANSYDWLREQVKAHLGFTWTDLAMEMNVVGIRGYMVPVGQVANIGDRWNDTILVAWIDAAGHKRVKSWVASTDPGAYYYSTRPLHPQGCAHLVAPQQVRYQPGPHGSRQQPAFVQSSNVTVARTNAANYTDRTHRFTDTPANRFWINLHPGFAWTEDQGVGASSAGCQNTKGAGWGDWRWLSLRDLLYTDRRGWFMYTLLEGVSLKR